MPFTTVTETEVSVILASATATLMGPPTVTTYHYSMTTQATAGQTLTVMPAPRAAATTDWLTKYTPTALPPISTSTITEVDILVQAAGGDIWQTIIYTQSPTSFPVSTAFYQSPYVPGEEIIVVPSSGSGWNSWNQNQKGGLVAGVALLGMLLMAILLICVGRRRSEWIVHQGVERHAPYYWYTPWRHPPPYTGRTREGRSGPYHPRW